MPIRESYSPASGEAGLFVFDEISPRGYSLRMLRTTFLWSACLAVLVLFFSVPFPSAANGEDGVSQGNQPSSSDRQSPKQKRITKAGRTIEGTSAQSSSSTLPVQPSNNALLQQSPPLIRPAADTIQVPAQGSKPKSRPIDGKRQALQQNTESRKVEPYVSLYGGVSLANSFTHVHGIQSVSFASLSDLDLARSPIYGVKLGIFQPRPQSWFGLETELFYANPHIKQQSVTVSGPGGSVTDIFAGARMRMMTWAFNWVVRYPGERIQPYAGVGLGIFWARLSGDDYGGNASDTSPGLNALGGIRVFLTKRVALMAEYKYNRASFDFGGNVSTHVLYQTHNLVGGLSIHF